MRIRTWFYAAAGAAVLTLAGHAVAADALEVPAISRPPTIDADLHDACWTQAARYTGFRSVTTGRPADAQTTVRLCRDATWLYAAFRCEESEPANIKTGVDTRDGSTPQDDSVEIFIDPGSSSRRYYQLALTAGNTQADQRVDFKEGKVAFKARYWDLPFRSAARPDPHLDSSTGWSAELAIPLAMLQELGPPGEWRMNICRTRRAVSPPEYSSLAPLPAGSGFHAPQHFVPVSGLTDLDAQRVFGPMLQDAEASPYVVEAGRYLYKVRATVKNQSGLGGRVTLVLQDLPQQGEGTRLERALVLPPVGEETVTFDVPVKAPTARAARLGLHADEPARLLQQTMVRRTQDLVPFDAYLDRDVYTTETRARVYGESAINAEGRKTRGIGMQAELLDAEGQVVAGDNVAPLLYDGQCAELPITSLAPGESMVRITFTDRDGNNLGVLERILHKRAPAPAGIRDIRIDRFNRCLLIDDQPFFPYGRTIFGSENDQCFLNDELDRCKAAGYNCVLDWNWNGGRGAAKAAEEEGITREQYVKNGLDAAWQRGLHVIGLPSAYWGQHVRYRDKDVGRKMLNALDKMEWYIHAMKDHPATLAYYSWDEPSPDIPTGIDLSMTEILVKTRDRIRTIDPFHAVYMSLSRVVKDPSWIGRTSDILGTHNYWIADQPKTLDAMAQWAFQTNEHLENAHRPTMIIVYSQGGKGGGPQTHEGRRAQVYLQLVHEARSMLYFGAITMKAVQESMERLAPEMHMLAPLLVRRSPLQTRTFEPETAVVPGWSPDTTFPYVQTLLKHHPEGGYVLLAVSGSWQPVHCRFEVSCLAKESSVYRLFGDGRSMPVKDQAFEETLEPLGRRVYRLTNVREIQRGNPVRIHLALSGETLEKGHLTLPEQEPATVNLLPNPGFEHPPADTGREDVTATRTRENPHSGDYCLELRKNEPQGYVDWKHEVITFEPDTTYRVGGWVRSGLSQGRRGPYLFVYDLNSVGSGKNRLNVTVGNVSVMQKTWTQVQRVFTTPGPPAVQARVWCRVPDEAAGKAWFDDLFLESLGQPRRNLIVNSSFEKDIRGFQGIPVDWPLFNFGYLLPHPDANGVTDLKPFHGKRCFRIPGRNDIVYQTKCRQGGVPVNRGTTYTLSAWMRADKPDTEVRMTFRNRYKQFTDVQVGTQWERFNHTDTIPSEGPLGQWRDVMVEFWLHSRNNSSVYIDAVQFEEGTDPTAYQP